VVFWDAYGTLIEPEWGDLQQRLRLRLSPVAFREALEAGGLDTSSYVKDVDRVFLALIEEARRRLGPDSRVSWLVADGECFSQGDFDLIIANATFQWFTSPGETLRAYFQALSPGGCVAFSTLGPETFGELDASLKQAAAVMGLDTAPEITARRFLNSRNWEDLLTQAGFSQVQMARRIITAHFPTVPDFLRALKAMGATNPRPRPFSPRLLHALIRAYEARFRQNGSVPATYEVIWAVARK